MLYAKKISSWDLADNTNHFLRLLLSFSLLLRLLLSSNLLCYAIIFVFSTPLDGEIDDADICLANDDRCSSCDGGTTSSKIWSNIDTLGGDPKGNFLPTICFSLNNFIFDASSLGDTTTNFVLLAVDVSTGEVNTSIIKNIYVKI